MHVVGYESCAVCLALMGYGTGAIVAPDFFFGPPRETPTPLSLLPPFPLERLSSAGCSLNPHQHPKESKRTLHAHCRYMQTMMACKNAKMRGACYLGASSRARRARHRTAVHNSRRELSRRGIPNGDRTADLPRSSCGATDCATRRLVAQGREETLTWSTGSTARVGGLGAYGISSQPDRGRGHYVWA